MTTDHGWLNRREVAKLLGIGGVAIAAGLPDRVFAQSRKGTLVIGLDISDTITLDPARPSGRHPNRHDGRREGQIRSHFRRQWRAVVTLGRA